MTQSGASEPIRGTAAGVPFVALPPAGDVGASAPAVVAWHLMDPPRTETAFAAALPLAGLDAWRFYLCLPMCGARSLAGGFEELMRLAMDDAVLNVYGPLVRQASGEFLAVQAELRARFDLA